MDNHNIVLNSSDIFDVIPGGFFIYYAYGNEELIYANKELLAILGCSSFEELKELTHNSFRGLVHPDDVDYVEESIQNQIQSNSKEMDYVEYRIIRKDGTIRWLEDFGHLIHHKAFGDIFYVFVSDITEKKEQLIRDVKMAAASALEHDSLTGLYTKEYFYKYADQIIQQNPDKKYAILVSDIENFKYINEQCGIEIGNEILKSIANNGAKHILGYKIGGRVDGDSFVALLEIISTSEDLMQSIRLLKDESIVPNLSIKHGLYDLNEDIPVNIMYNRAFLALNSIKGIYGQYIQKYNDNLRIHWMMKQRIMDSAEESLQNNHFQVYYQPKYRVSDHTVIGAEALVRWIHPDFGFMNPGIFIPVFEENGFIKTLDTYIREEVCRTLSSWQAKGISLVPISVNISRKDFEDPEFVHSIISMVDSYHLDHRFLHLEVTESCYVENPQKITSDVQALHDAGFAIELDDFGSGYSTLASLNGMPIDTLKIDMSIIREDIPGSTRNILEFIMQLAKMMNLKTIQEGVETQEQLDRITALGCDYVQGYYFSKPISKESFLELLN